MIVYRAALLFDVLPSEEKAPDVPRVRAPAAGVSVHPGLEGGDAAARLPALAPLH